ncbi:MAG: DNA gyrase subunit A, partial [Clostridiales bacterium]|nr:DNA gyrase subunit A [Clostridiales bacterium]
IRNIIPIDNFEEEDLYLTTVTRYGVIKKTSIDKYANINKNGLIATKIREGDSVVAVQLTRAGQEVIVVSAAGKSVRFNSDDARDMGRGATGVRAMRLADDDEVVGMEPVDPSREILVISEKGYGKRSKIDDYRVQSRGGKGIITYKVSEKTGRLCGTVSVTDDDDLLIITSQGVIIRVRANEIPTLSRATSGVKLMKSNEALVVDFALTDREEEEPEEGAPENGDITDADSEVTAVTGDNGEGLSPNAEKVRELADTLAAEIEAEDIAVSEDKADNDEDGDDI